MTATPYGQAGELVVLASRQLDKVNATASELVLLVSCGAPPSRYIPAGELVLLASTVEDKVVTEVAECLVLVSYVSKGTQRFDQRSWGFTLDQHQFYVLHLGDQGTLIFDDLTQQWAQWQTQGFVTWNAEAGVEWNNGVYFGDNELPTLWRMDVDGFLDDDFRPILRVVTGGIPAEAGDTLRSGTFTLSATQQSAVDDESVPYVQLSISDDAGETYKDREAITANGKVVQDFSWRGLGVIRIPGRVFKITDEGAVVTIKGANQDIQGEKPPGQPGDGSNG